MGLLSGQTWQWEIPHKIVISIWENHLGFGRCSGTPRLIAGGEYLLEKLEVWKICGKHHLYHPRGTREKRHLFGVLLHSRTKMIDHVVVYEKRENLGALMCKKVLIGLSITVIVSKIK